MTNATLLAIKAELTNDPTLLGLTVLAADDEANANKLNGVNPLIQVDRSFVSVSELDFDVTEYEGLSPASRSWLDLQTRSGSVRPALIRDGLNTIFGAQTNTRASYESVFTEAGNRIQQMVAAGLIVEEISSVSPSDVANARNAV